MSPFQPSDIEHVSIDALIPYVRNPRTHSEAQVAQVAASIREFGFTNPVLIDDEMGIIAGHGRVMAARKLGLDRVPCIRLSHLSEAQKRAYVIADNKLALNAGWDEELLALELGDLRNLDYDLDLTGFTPAEVDHALNGWDSDMDALDGIKETSDAAEAVIKVVCSQEASSELEDWLRDQLDSEECPVRNARVA